MKGYIDGFNWLEDFEPQKYWSFPASWTREKKAKELNSMLYSGNYIASPKMDGYWEMFIKDESGNMFLRSRNKGVNGVVDKIDWVPHLFPFFEAMPNKTILLGEVYLPGKTSKDITKILGCGVNKAIDRQKKGDFLNFFIFDILYKGGIPSHNKPISSRALELNKLREHENDYIQIAPYWDDPEAIHENWLRILAEGGEGIVMTESNYPYSQNKRTARKTLKLKKELEETIDVFLTGHYKKPTSVYTGQEVYSWPFWEDIATGEKVFGDVSTRVSSSHLRPVTKAHYYSWAASVEIAVMREGKILPIGWISGVTDEVKEGITKDPKSYFGRVVELQAMEIDRSGELPTLRHGRIVKWRSDKNYQDCSWQQLL